MKCILLLILQLVLANANTENWPQFRGPNSQGRSSETSVPLAWSATENIAWKPPLPGESWSSPIVWQDTVFVTTATDEGKSCHVLALDRRNGKILWDREGFQQSPGHKEGRNTYATSMPTTDGERVYACFFDGSFAALDFAGKVVWTNRGLHHYGHLPGLDGRSG
jgi:outer membrane protein assembly factor BamB